MLHAFHFPYNLGETFANLRQLVSHLSSTVRSTVPSSGNYTVFSREFRECSSEERDSMRSRDTVRELSLDKHKLSLEKASGNCAS